MADEPLSRVGKGDPITADWANAVADAINGRGASDPNANGTATPYGIMTPADVDTQMRAPDAQAMPFDAAIIREGSDGDALYMALPNAPDYVFDGAGVLSPSPAQTLGNAQSAWVRIEAVTNNTARYVSLAVTLPDSSTTPPIPPYWRLFVASSPTARPSWADPARPVVLLAGYNIAADDPSGTDTAPGDVPSLLKGLVQYHRGTVNLGDGSGETPDSECTANTTGQPGQSIQRWTGDEGDENNGALELFKFTDAAQISPGGSGAEHSTYFDSIFDFVVRDKQNTRWKVNYLKPSDIIGGTFSCVVDIGIADGYFYKDIATYELVGPRFREVTRARTNIFRVANCPA